MSICKEKPESLPALDAIGIEPSDQINYPMSRGGTGRHHRQGSGAVPPQCQDSTSLGFNPGSSFSNGGSSSTFSMGDMGNFATSIGGSKLNNEERFNMTNNMHAVSPNAVAAPTTIAQIHEAVSILQSHYQGIAISSHFEGRKGESRTRERVISTSNVNVSRRIPPGWRTRRIPSSWC